MNTEHERVIEAMAGAFIPVPCGIGRRAAESALRAAAEQGYVLAKLPGRITAQGSWSKGSRRDWNACLDAIETIELEGGDE